MSHITTVNMTDMPLIGSVDPPGCNCAGEMCLVKYVDGTCIEWHENLKKKKMMMMIVMITYGIQVRKGMIGQFLIELEVYPDTDLSRGCQVWSNLEITLSAGYISRNSPRAYHSMNLSVYS